ncbi:TPA: antitermination protein [Citrobacter farmeri]|nr:antitermination protein [Citrobacter farmeri]
MHENLLNFARIEITRALVDNSGRTKGQLQAFNEHPPADKNRNPRQPVHIIELEGDRWVKAENGAVYVMETRSRRRPMPPITDHEFAAAPWRRAVNSLCQRDQAWIRYCYGYDLKFSLQRDICKAIWDQHQRHLPAGLLNKTRKRLVGLVWLAAQEVAAQQGNDTYKCYAGAALARLMDVGRSTWLRVYAQHWQQMKELAQELDRRALVDTLALRDEIIEKERKCS